MRAAFCFSTVPILCLCLSACGPQKKVEAAAEKSPASLFDARKFVESAFTQCVLESTSDRSGRSGGFYTVDSKFVVKGDVKWSKEAMPDRVKGLLDDYLKALGFSLEGSSNSDGDDNFTVRGRFSGKTHSGLFYINLRKLSPGVYEILVVIGESTR